MPGVGYVFDPVYLEHAAAGHPERPERLRAIVEGLEAEGLIDQLAKIPAREATPDEIARVHTGRHIRTVRETAASGGGWLDADTYLNERSYDAALAAAGGLIEATDAVFDGRVGSAFALVRPPGHHALPDRGMGFCLFNNAAIAARHALEERGLERVAIVDFDVHHGNGTQEAFYEDPSVLYFSTHQWPHYPGTGHWSERGRGRGEGYTVNVPLPPGTGDEGYGRAFDEILVPLLMEQRPQLILASAGYDAHWRDPLAGMGLSIAGYARLVGMLQDLASEACGGRLVLTLEGGYELEVLARSVAATFRALLGQELADDPLGSSPLAEPDISEIITAAREAHGLGS